ncbi:restriction endonuclease subunit S [Ornithinibacillus californiensis]|uniref:restriction endonuclease subunit S n=1 Tax=Ornithinibacillus californiensis TaxID=161536 RepID=UPI00064E0BE7|nr:restriction endonuclease subunit S [Ornithinibacillus californiensis]
MEIEFQRTGIGELPSEWGIGTMKDIAEINPESLSSNTPANQIIEYIDIESIKEGKVQGTKLLEFSDAPSRARRITRKNDVIVSTVRPYLKAFALIKESKKNLVCSTGFAVIRSKEQQSAEFIYHYTFSHTFLSQLLRKMVGSNYPAVNKSDIAEVLVPIPTLEEQQKIAEILTTVDEQIAQTAQLIEKTLELKKGLLQRLLSKGLDHKEFKDSEYEEIPINWDLVPLESLCENITYGFTNPMPETNNGPYMITAKDIVNGKINYDTARKTDINKFNSELTPKSKPLLNDLLITKDGTLGRLAIVDREEICINQSVATLRLKHDLIDARFIYYLLSSNKMQQRILFDAGGSTIKHIYITKLAKMKVPIPQSIEEQREIVEILSTVDVSIDYYNKNQRSLQVLKKGLMQQLFTGKIRVKV